MKSVRDANRFLLAVLATTGLACALSCVVCSHLIVNWTSSLPVGLYWLSRSKKPTSAELVAFSIPVQVRRLVVERQYLPEGAYLVKPVAAMPGDHVCVSRGELRINGERFGAVFERDSAGRALPTYAICEEVRPGQLYVASAAHQSFDSRAFGPVDARHVRGTVIPLWTF